MLYNYSLSLLIIIITIIFNIIIIIIIIIIIVIIIKEDKDTRKKVKSIQLIIKNVQTLTNMLKERKTEVAES